MFKRKFTVVTQLHEKNNQEIIDYIDNSRGVYAKALRETFYVIKNSEEFDKSKYNSQLQTKYGILKRTANSIITDAQGQLNALKELKIYEQKQLESKIQIGLKLAIKPKQISKELLVMSLNLQEIPAKTYASKT